MEDHVENVVNGTDVTIFLMANSTLKKQDSASDPSKK
jgi:hypothetical protein